MRGSQRSWVALGLLLGLNPRYRGQLSVNSVSPEVLLLPTPGALEAALSLRPQEARDIFSRNFPEWADKEIQKARERGVAIVTFEDPGYPPGLRHLPDAPSFLYVRGRIEPDDALAVAVVGSRRASPYGLRVAAEIGQGLAAAGLTVVSGLARGIDTAAQRGAMQAGGRTLGVLGSGIDVIYPKENGSLFDQVSAAGAVVTEFPFGTPPLAHHFPIRNRIIAAMSAAVVVVEAARDSGSLITARIAADEMGLPVCAVPGPITSRTSQGCNDLLYDGATPVRDVQDIIDELPDRMRRHAFEMKRINPAGEERDRGRRGIPRDVSPEALEVLRFLKPDEPRSADELAASTKLASAPLLGHLLELELEGLAAQLPGGFYISKN